MRDLLLRLKREYFEQIRDGTKTEEYRLAWKWIKRLKGQTYDRIILTLGYPKDNGIEGVTRLTMKWRGCEYRELTHPHFGNEPVFVYAIDVSERWAPESAQNAPETGAQGGWAVPRASDGAKSPEAAPEPSAGQNHLDLPLFGERVIA